MLFFFSEEELSTGVKTDKINIENVGKKVILNQGDLFYLQRHDCMH